MTETPKRRRLTDEEVALGYDVSMGNRPYEAGAPLLSRLRVDHGQAREDRKALALSLRNRLLDCCGEPDPSGGRCERCCADAVLLAEVGA